MERTYGRNKGNIMKFVCPKCNGTKLEEVMKYVTVSSKINDVGEGGDINYGEQSNEDGEVDFYQCLDCGEELVWDDGTTVESNEELYDWLKEHNMI